MTGLRYDETALVRDLARMEGASRAAFAAACAERLFPAYAEFCERAGRGNRDALAGILERVWRHLFGDPMSSEQVRAERDRCVALVPGEDDEPWVAEQAYADDACAAVAYALRALDTGEPQEAAWAGQRAYEAADHHVVHRLGVEGESKVLAHPIVQAEIARQRRDIDALLGARRDSVELFVSLRERARVEAPGFFASHP
jgi:uncharacterized protein YjaG (DUF416 family)